jgi:hypothetical protein
MCDSTPLQIRINRFQLKTHGYKRKLLCTVAYKCNCESTVSLYVRHHPDFTLWDCISKFLNSQFNRSGCSQKFCNACFRLYLDTADIYGGWLSTQMMTCLQLEDTTKILQCGGEINCYGVSRCAASTNL